MKTLLYTLSLHFIGTEVAHNLSTYEKDFLFTSKQTTKNQAKKHFCTSKQAFTTAQREKKNTVSTTRKRDDKLSPIDKIRNMNNTWRLNNLKLSFVHYLNRK